MKDKNKKVTRGLLLVVAMLLPTMLYAQGIENPIESETITEILITITKWILGLVAILALLSLIVGGTWMILAFGREDSVKKAKQIIFWAIVGLIVVIASYAIINIVVYDFLGVVS